MAEQLTKEDVLKELGSLKDTLETSLKDSAKAEVSAQLKETKEQFEKLQKQLAEKPAGVSADDLQKVKAEMAEIVKNSQETLQSSFDEMQGKVLKANMHQQNRIKSLGEVIKEKMQEHGVKFSQGKGDAGSGGEIEKALSSQNGSYIVPLGPVDIKADMTLAVALTGDPVASYNQRQSLAPAQAVNFRDLMPTVQSPTGLYVTYSENAGLVNNIAAQTEGSTKGQNEYDFTEVKTVTKYIAGFSVFTKQLLKFLPFMEGTLTRALLRDFYKAENAAFYSTVSGAATGSTIGGSAPDDVKQLITVIANQKDANYNPSYVLVSNAIMARLIISTYTTGYYAGAGAVAVGQGGVITIWGVPIIAASWIGATKALIVDSSYLERVEVEGLNLAFSYEDSTNFRQNKVTARIECMEEVNLMRAASCSFIDLGAS